MPTSSEMIYVKTNVGGYFFDAVIRTDHTSRLQITEHPVQTGATITDHAFLQPKELVMEIKMSDVARDRADGQFSGGWSKSVTAYQRLRDLQANRIPIQVLTRLGLYQNMMIEVISAPDDYKTLYGLSATITMKEIMVAEVQTVRISARPQVTNSTQRGTPETVKPNQSILTQLKDLFFGK